MNKKLSAKEVIQALESRKDESISIAESVVVKNNSDKETAIDHIAVANAIIKDTLKKRGKVVPKLHEAWKASVAQYASITDPLNSAIGIIRKKISDFDLSERRRIEDANRKRIAESEAKEAAKQKRLNERAKDLEGQGRTEEAEAKSEEADAYVAPAPDIEAVEKTMKTEVGSYTTTFEKKAEVVDEMAVVNAIAGGQLPIGMIHHFDNKVLQGWVKTFDPKVGSIVHGIKIIEVPKGTFRSSK